MRTSTFFLSCLVIPTALSMALFACGSDGAGGGQDSGAPADGSSRSEDGSIGSDGSAGADAGSPGKDAGTASDGGSASDGSASDGSASDAMTGSDGSVFDAGTDSGGVDAGPPGCLYVGRFDVTDPLGARMAWPGTRIVARFDGTDASVTLSEADGFAGGPSWFNIILDGVPQTPFSVSGASAVYPLAAGLGAGVHTVEIEKRNEANRGTVRFEGMTFTGGAGLLPPPPPAARRIEFLTDSTIDGFGVEGDRNVTCMGGAPTQFDNARKSMSFLTAAGLSADMILTGYSAKGIQKNGNVGDLDTFPIIFPRSLPEKNPSIWDFAKITPDAVVMSLGGTDMDNLSAAPAGFENAYAAFVATVRSKYPNAYIWL